MSYSFTQTGSQAFTITHARYLASKVATDLKRIQRFYGCPTDTRITEYETELVELLRNGYLDNVTYGFKRGDNWIEPTLRYTAKELSGLTSADDDPGKIKPGADISGASFYSFLTYNSAYLQLTREQQNSFESSLPFKRGDAQPPGIFGYLTNDKSYSTGGKALDRSYVKTL